MTCHLLIFSLSNILWKAHLLVNIDLPDSFNILVSKNRNYVHQSPGSLSEPVSRPYRELAMTRLLSYVQCMMERNDV